MKTLFKILLFVFCFIGAILSIAMTAIEARLIFSVDWIVCSTPLSGLIRYLARFILALFSLSVAVAEIANSFKNNKNLSVALYVAQISLLAAFSTISIFTANYIGLAATGLSLIILAIKSLQLIFKK